MIRGLIFLLAAGAIYAQTPAAPQTQTQAGTAAAGGAARGGQRPPNPTRDAHTPGYVDAKRGKRGKKGDSEELNFGLDLIPHCPRIHPNSQRRCQIARHTTAASLNRNEESSKTSGY
jgi:hypothetical protein